MIRNAIRLGAAASAVALLLLTACDPVEQVDAREIYLANCAACHGPAGKGDGPLASDLDPRPSDLTQIARRNDGVFDYRAVMAMIDGYNAPHRDMPRYSNMLAQADTMYFDTGDGIMTPTPVPLVALAEYLESIQVED